MNRSDRESGFLLEDLSLPASSRRASDTRDCTINTLLLFCATILTFGGLHLAQPIISPVAFALFLIAIGPQGGRRSSANRFGSAIWRRPGRRRTGRFNARGRGAKVVASFARQGVDGEWQRDSAGRFRARRVVVKARWSGSIRSSGARELRRCAGR